jgi:hypothetical protein
MNPLRAFFQRRRLAARANETADVEQTEAIAARAEVSAAELRKIFGIEPLQK